MSYEGYVQMICDNGHYAERDAHDDGPHTCDECGAGYKLENKREVDQTNDSGIRHEMDLVTPAVVYNTMYELSRLVAAVRTGDVAMARQLQHEIMANTTAHELKPATYRFNGKKRDMNV